MKTSGVSQSKMTESVPLPLNELKLTSTKFNQYFSYFKCLQSSEMDPHEFVKNCFKAGAKIINKN